eukprot:843556-Pelagomonas_calceolata.AAC.3
MMWFQACTTPCTYGFQECMPGQGKLFTVSCADQAPLAQAAHQPELLQKHSYWRLAQVLERPGLLGACSVFVSSNQGGSFSLNMPAQQQKAGHG